jgi:hypothetical protein
LFWNDKVTKDTAQLERARQTAEAELQEVDASRLPILASIADRQRYTVQATRATNNRKVQTNRTSAELDREHKAATEAVKRAERQYVCPRDFVISLRQ